MREKFRGALSIAVLALAACAGLLEPLARGPFGAPGVSGVLEHAIGGAITGAAILALVVAPILFVIHWVARDRIAIPKLGWALIGSVVAMSPVVAFNLQGAPIGTRISETIDAISSLDGFASWFPYILGGGVFGWRLFGKSRPTHAEADSRQ